jgi:hypothetical protein
MVNLVNKVLLVRGSMELHYNSTETQNN